MVDRAESFSTSCLLAGLALVQCSLNPVEDHSRKEVGLRTGSRPGPVRRFTNLMAVNALHSGGENRRDDISVLVEMMWEEADVAIEEKPTFLRWASIIMKLTTSSASTEEKPAEYKKRSPEPLINWDLSTTLACSWGDTAVDNIDE
ncbi:hypothetical protein Y032_0003g1302 [Ancylostoma ceylanicum]|uniref:Uncharacterized protein n=1 Tax=Ancylostoma ceylanicum TaxID=53326 RepID=A0A016VY09_9BILA|nr:hypothetical protein Y032_0003g1302 [Ancylostoma ceylanicum]